MGKYEADRSKEADKVKSAGRFEFQVTGVSRPSWPCTSLPPFDMQDTPISSQMSSHRSRLVQTEFLSLATKIPA